MTASREPLDLPVVANDEFARRLDLAAQHGAFAPADGVVRRNASPEEQLLHRLGRHPNIPESVR